MRGGHRSWADEAVAGDGTVADGLIGDAESGASI
jgi:hypothetical protein